MNKILSLLLVSALLIASGCTTISNDIYIPSNSSNAGSKQSISGNISIGESAKVGNQKTISGDIDSEDGVTTRNLKTISGDVSIGARVSVFGSINTISGDIETGENCEIDGSIESISGDIDLAAGNHVAGNVKSISGDIDLMHSTIEKDIVTYSGSVTLTGSSVRDIIIKKKPENNGTTYVDIGPESTVDTITAKDPESVELRIHHSASVNNTTDIEADYYE